MLTDFPTQSEPSSGLERGAIEVSERSLRENFMPPWIGAITKAGGLGVMAGYPEVEDVPAHASVKWMNDVLRHEIGFQGIVQSEGGGFGTLLYEHIVPTQKEAGLLALRAGVDLNITYEPAYMGPLVESVEEGRVPMALVDRARAQSSGAEVPPGPLREPLCACGPRRPGRTFTGPPRSGPASRSRRDRAAEKR